MNIVIEVIAEYLKSNRRLVVPAFGAFMVKDTGELVFSELLRTDDKILTSLLCGRGLSDMEVAVTIDRFVFEVRNELEQYGYCRLGEVGTLRVEPDTKVIRLYPPIKSEEALPGESTPYVPEPISELEREAMEAEVAAADAAATVEEVASQGVLSLEDEPAPEMVEDIVLEPVSNEEAEPSVEEPEQSVVETPTVEQVEEEECCDDELSNEEPQQSANLQEEVKPQVEEVEASSEPFVLKPQAEVQKPKKKRRVKFDVVMFVAIVVTIAALAMLALGIYNTCVSDKADNSADDAAIEEARMKNRVE